MKTRAVAVLGCGSIGQRHIGNLLQLGREVVAFDPSPSARAATGIKHGIAVYDDLNDVWGTKPELALICTPSNMHLALASEAARHSCHLFIEKPLAHTLDDVENLHQLVDSAGLVNMVACNMRFHPGPATIKRWLDEGRIGELISARIQTGSYLPRWRPQQDYQESYSASLLWGGAVLDCIHELDLALWLLGPATLHAAVVLPAHSISLHTDGLAEILLRHRGGVVSNVHLNFVQRNYRRSIQVIGTEGTIEWDFTAASVDLYGPDGNLVERIAQDPAWQVNQMYVDELSHLLGCIATGQQTCNPIATATQTLRLALTVREVA